MECLPTLLQGPELNFLHHVDKVCCYMFEISARREQRLKDLKFKVILGYVGSLRLAWAI